MTYFYFDMCLMNVPTNNKYSAVGFYPYKRWHHDIFHRVFLQSQCNFTRIFQNTYGRYCSGESYTGCIENGAPGKNGWSIRLVDLHFT